MDSLSTFLQSALVTVGAPVFLLGFLIFIHELGHFLFARLFGVGVEQFSFGFGPRLFGFVRNGTDYRVNAIPLGGYVKMVGGSPFEEDEDVDNRPDSFTNKPVWQRFLIMFGGPLFNLVLPILLFTAIYMIGWPRNAAWVGTVEPGSSAAEAGLLPGDRILKVGSVAVFTDEDLFRAVESLPTGGEVQVLVSREGSERSLPVRFKVEDGMTLDGELRPHNVLGVEVYGPKPLVGVLATETSPAFKAGLRAGDLITSVNGTSIEWWYELEKAARAAGGAEIQVKYTRDGKSGEARLSSMTVDPVSPLSPYALAAYGLFPGEIFLQRVLEGKPAYTAGLRPGDMLLNINGRQVQGWYDIKSQIESPPDQPKLIRAMRGTEVLELKVIPEVVSAVGPSGQTRQEGRISISPMAAYGATPETVRLGLFDALANGTKETATVIALNARLLKQVITGDIPLTESLGGPISIVTVAVKSAWISIFEYVRIMVLISVSLGLINLLPIPMLDGGHILFLAAEGLRGEPVSMRFREVSQQIGLILLFILMAFAFANDVRVALLR